MSLSLEGIVHGPWSTWGSSTRALATGLLGLGILGAGSPVPAYGQQNAKYASNNVVYVPCTQQQAQMLEEAANRNKGKKENWGELLSLLGVLGGFQSNANAQKLGAAALTLGQMEHQKEVAREGRTQVTVNQGQQQMVRYVPFPGCAWANPENPNDFSVRRSLGMAFAANYWKDFDKDGHVDLNEYVGIKDRFYDNENIVVVLHDPQGTKREITSEFYDPKGNVLQQDSTNSVGVVRFGSSSDGTSSDLMSWLLTRGDYGKYVVVWRAEGITEMTKFEIIPTSDNLGVAYRSEAARLNRSLKSAQQGDSGGLNSAAWLYATSSDPNIRNPQKALEYALKAVAATEEKNANVLDTLAESYYANGQYEKAIETERKALALQPRDEFQERLRKYEDAARGKKQ